MSSTSADIRTEIVKALCLDLVGPDNDHLFANELLPEQPSRWYLSGYLLPCDAPEDQKHDPTAEDDADSGDDTDGTDDSHQPDKAATRSYLPSSMGLTVLTKPGTDSLQITAEWGDYSWESSDNTPEPGTKEAEGFAGGTNRAAAVEGYRRRPFRKMLSIPIPRGGKAVETSIPESNGVAISIAARPVNAAPLPAGTMSVSVFLVNKRAAQTESACAYRSYIFQAKIGIHAANGLVPRPDLRGSSGSALNDEWDEKLADLQYRDVYEFAVGHGVSAMAAAHTGEHCTDVASTWMPQAFVERVAPSKIDGVELDMEKLSAIADHGDAQAKLLPLVHQYRDWIAAQSNRLSGLSGRRLQTAQELLQAAQHASTRIEAGVAALSDPKVLEAFRIANRCMAQAARRREMIARQIDIVETQSPRWYPFQLAFMLINIPAIADPLHADRERVDLLFFPTGGGKTEAYLGLSAFTMVLRRLKNPGVRSAGLSVLMRYTLRLLTLDQLGRAAALICALELERRKDKKLGEWPFEIGLWVGSAATPNRMGHRGYDGPGRDDTAYMRTRRFQRESSNPAPVPLENCPWCGRKFEKHSFRLEPNETSPRNLAVYCANSELLISASAQFPAMIKRAPFFS
jgi:hypothetical protein